MFHLCLDKHYYNSVYVTFWWPTKWNSIKQTKTFFVFQAKNGNLWRLPNELLAFRRPNVFAWNTCKTIRTTNTGLVVRRRERRPRRQQRRQQRHRLSSPNWIPTKITNLPRHRTTIKWRTKIRRKPIRGCEWRRWKRRNRPRMSSVRCPDRVSEATTIPAFTGTRRRCPRRKSLLRTRAILSRRWRHQTEASIIITKSGRVFFCTR